MSCRIFPLSLLICFLPFMALQYKWSSAAEIPHLEKRGPVTQLIVSGEPYLVLGGELHNSSSSSLEYMQPIWPKLATPLNFLDATLIASAFV